LLGNDWSQVGSQLNGESAGDSFGQSVALSADGLQLAVGASWNDANGTRSGQVRVFHFINEDWTQVGSAMNGENTGDFFGSSLALSASGAVLAAGATGNEAGNGAWSGHVRIFELVDGDWVQLSSSINGKGIENWFGRSVALSADGKTVAVSASLGYAVVYRQGA